jgi:heterodisulfide reductase subunit B2
MKQYSYYPSCCLHGEAVAYDISVRETARVLNVELRELEGWNCCGSTPFAAIDELGALCCAVRNLALAEKVGLELVTPCSDCYLMLNKANLVLRERSEMKHKVAEALAAGGLEYHGNTRVRHILDVFANDVGSAAIKFKVARSLEGLKVAAYYGCQVVRPCPGFDHPENPVCLENLIVSLGCEPVPFPLKTHCCGGSLFISETDSCLELLYKLLQSASEHGAQCLVTVCALCQANLDMYQSLVNRRFKTHFNLPVLFFTQLMGMAFDIQAVKLGLEKGLVPAEKALAGYLGN